jgi:hypothetical protein
MGICFVFERRRILETILLGFLVIWRVGATWEEVYEDVVEVLGFWGVHFYIISH